MGLRYHKSIKVGENTRVNISNSGVGVSTSVKGLRVSTGPSGTRITASLPGTGLSYRKSVGKKKKSK